MLPRAGLTVLTVLVLQARAEADCQAGWVDAGAVGLGCLLADITTADLNQTSAQAVCQSYGQGGRLLEITSLEQITFLQGFLTEASCSTGAQR